jgi:pyruvate decarboxylase
MAPKEANGISIGMYIFHRLHGLGVRHILGVPGDFNLGLLDNISRIPDMEWVGCCNELNAAYAADGYARTRGLPGVLVTTYGVGELSAINGIAGAYSEQVPIIHIVGTTSRKMHQERSMIHHTLGENFDHGLFQHMSEPVRKTAAHLTDESKFTEEVDRVLEVAVKSRLPVYLFVPIDVPDIIVDRSPLEKPLDLEIRNTGRQDDENELVIEILQKLKNSQFPVILADVLAHRHGLVQETRNLVKLTGVPASNPRADSSQSW